MIHPNELIPGKFYKSIKYHMLIHISDPTISFIERYKPFLLIDKNMNFNPKDVIGKMIILTNNKLVQINLVRDDEFEEIC